MKNYVQKRMTELVCTILFSAIGLLSLAQPVDAVDDTRTIDLSNFFADQYFTMNDADPDYLFEIMQDNDTYPPGSIFEVIENCGTAYFTYPTYFSGTGLQILFTISTLFAPVPGIYTACYKITAPDGQTDNAIIYITVKGPDNFVEEQCPPTDPCPQNNLWCHGDFEDFLPFGNSGQPQIGLQTCNLSFGSPILDVCNGNIFYGLFGPNNLMIPLSSPIKPGCKLTIKAKMAGENITYSVLFSDVSPCDAFNATPCANDDFGCIQLSCENPQGFSCVETLTLNTGTSPDVNASTPCDDPEVVEQIGNTCEQYNFDFSEYIVTTQYEPCWKNIELQYTNTSTEDWNYIAIDGTAGQNYLFIDDLELTTDCGCQNPATGEGSALAESGTGTVVMSGSNSNASFSGACEVPWEIVCYEQDNYFCVVNPQGASYYMTWNEPAFPADPNGHCQDLSVMTPGQPIQFTIYTFDDNGNKCPYVVNTTWECGQTGGGGDDPACACPNPPDDGDNGGKRNALAIHSENFEMRLMPNPANDLTRLTVVCPQEIIGTLSIYDITGKLVVTQRLNLPAGKSTQPISLGQLGSGTYNIELTNSLGIRLALNKLVVVRD